jgi:hypothetical protein
VEQCDEELRFEEIVVLVDAVDKPVVVEDVEQDVAVFHAFVSLPADAYDVPAGTRVEHETGVLLLHVLCGLEEVDGEGVCEFVGDLMCADVGGVQQEDVVL